MSATPGQLFDDFLITTRELVNTCKVCPDTCAQKSVHDQIIEGLIDGGTIENLLQEADLTLPLQLLNHGAVKLQARAGCPRH